MFICYVESDPNGTDHMEYLDAADLEQAKRQAHRILRQHDRAYAARIFAGNDCVGIISLGSTSREMAAAIG